MAPNVLGAQLYTCREFTKTIDGVADTLRKVADIGYTAVQISGFGPVDPKEVAKLLDDTGLTCAATHVGWPRFREDLDAVIEEHKLWKCEHPAIGGLPKEYFSADGAKRFADELGPIVEKLSAAGMDFSYHNHNHELAKYDGRTWLSRLYFDAAGPELLKAEIDVYWITAGGGDPAAWIRCLGDRQPLVHFKDMIVTPEREQRFAEIGEGNLNWDAIVEACQEVGVRWYLVEQDKCYERDPFDSLKISYENLAKMGLS